jgi:hypothetical protein
MKRLLGILLVALLIAAGCMHRGPGSGWTTLIDGEKGLQNFSQIGEANWRPDKGAIVADKGKDGYLVTKDSYADFALYAEFWADPRTNSGVHVRASDPKEMRPDNSYEVNIYDQRPGPEYGTGSIVGFAQVPVPAKYKAGGKWNVLEVYAKGPQITVKLNGDVTVHMVDSKFKSGPIGLQYGSGPEDSPGGAIKWRKVDIRPL